MAAEGVDRRSFLEIPVAVTTAFAVGGVSAAFAEDEWKTTASGLQYSVITEGKGGFKAKKGDLAAIRFQGSYNGNVFDDILSAQEPLYFRIGDGRLLKGVEEACELMTVGSKYKLKIPGDIAFGVAGRGASPGKPRIPPGATIDFVLELAGLPGKEDDLIEVIGDV